MVIEVVIVENNRVRNLNEQDLFTDFIWRLKQRRAELNMTPRPLALSSRVDSDSVNREEFKFGHFEVSL